MRPAKSKPYRRSWKNLLLNKRYQLGFTLFMVGLSALLMSFLGYWVVREAKRATEVAINNVEGQRCPPIPDLSPGDGKGVIIDEITEMEAPQNGVPAPAPGAEAPAAEAPAAEAPAAAAPGGAQDTAKPGATEAGPGSAGVQVPAAGAEPGDTKAEPGSAGVEAPAAGAEPGSAGAEAPAAGAEPGSAGAEAPAAGAEPDSAEATGRDDARARPEVVLDEGTVLLDLPPTVPPDFVEAVIQHYRCQHERVTKIAGLHTGYRRILGVLIGVGVMLILGLTFSGIKMTHRLAGPLYKVQLYFDKMREGRFDEVHDLRKGDQLVEFYEQFKAAHGGLRLMQELDIEHLRAVIEVAEANNLAARSPELAATLDEMRETLARKEKSIE
jgi:hypothetical protein